MKPRRARSLILPLVAALCAGCSTKLVIRAVVADPGPESRAAAPKGLVVNRLATYGTRVTSSHDELVVTSSTKSHVLMDPHRVLEVNYCRMPFANGKLVLEVAKDAQIPTKLGVSGTSPAPDLVKAVDKGLGTSNDIEKLLAPAPGP